MIFGGGLGAMASPRIAEPDRFPVPVTVYSVFWTTPSGDPIQHRKDEMATPSRKSRRHGDLYLWRSKPAIFLGFKWIDGNDDDGNDDDLWDL